MNPAAPVTMTFFPFHMNFALLFNLKSSLFHVRRAVCSARNVVRDKCVVVKPRQFLQQKNKPDQQADRRSDQVSVAVEAWSERQQRCGQRRVEDEKRGYDP